MLDLPTNYSTQMRYQWEKESYCFHTLRGGLMTKTLLNYSYVTNMDKHSALWHLFTFFCSHPTTLHKPSHQFDTKLH